MPTGRALHRFKNFIQLTCSLEAVPKVNVDGLDVDVARNGDVSSGSVREKSRNTDPKSASLPSSRPIPDCL